MNRLEIKQAISNEMQLDPGLVSNAERELFINAWLDDMASLGLLEKAVVIEMTEGQYSVPIPANCITIVEVRHGTKVLTLDRRRDGNTTGKTSSFYVEAGTIILQPPPETADDLTIVMAYRPAHLTSDVGVPDLPVSWHYMGVLYAVFRSHRKNGNIAMAREYQAEYEAKKAEKAREALMNYNSRIRVIGEAAQPQSVFSFLKEE